MPNFTRRDCLFLALLYAFYLALCALFIFPSSMGLIHDNANMAFPFFRFMLQTLHETKALPVWIEELHQGMPASIFFQSLFVLLLTRYPFYALALLSPVLPS